jgi:hypothetical protein
MSPSQERRGFSPPRLRRDARDLYRPNQLPKNDGLLSR